MSDPNHQPDDPLDALIQNAVRESTVQSDASETTSLQVERLTRYWRSLNEAEQTITNRRFLPWFAAAVLLISGAGLATYAWLSPSDPLQPVEVAEENPTAQDEQVADEQPQTAETRRVPEPQEVPPLLPERVVAASESLPQDFPRSISRQPTELERLMFVARTRTRVPRVEKTLSETIDDALERLVKRPEFDPRQFRSLSQFAAKSVEQELLARLPLGTVEEQNALLRMLAVHGSDGSVDALIRLTDKKSVRAEALATLEAIAGIKSWPSLTERITNPEARKAISERLIAALDDENPRIRTAATEAIGKSFDCTVTAGLIERVVRQPSQNEETWFALFACRCPQADAFLWSASQNPKLLGQFNHARLQWELQ